jgi:hypothetical protein
VHCEISSLNSVSVTSTRVFPPCIDRVTHYISCAACCRRCEAVDGALVNVLFSNVSCTSAEADRRGGIRTAIRVRLRLFGLSRCRHCFCCCCYWCCRIFRVCFMCIASTEIERAGGGSGRFRWRLELGWCLPPNIVTLMQDLWRKSRSNLILMTVDPPPFGGLRHFKALIRMGAILFILTFDDELRHVARSLECMT